MKYITINLTNDRGQVQTTTYIAFKNNSNQESKEQKVLKK
jgi:hypothetical protein